MHLLRIQVPKFKALKDVDITFEQDFVPKVFPLGSQNGGGKNTLLQLIFVLLHCAQDVEKLPFVKAMLAHFIVPPEEVEPKLLAQMDIWDGEKIVEIEFLCCNDNFLSSLPEFERCNRILAENDNINTFEDQLRLENDNVSTILKGILREYKASFSAFCYLEDIVLSEKKFSKELGNKNIFKIIINLLKPIISFTERSSENKDFGKQKSESFIRFLTEFKQETISKKLIYITAYSEQTGLFCRVNNLEINEAENFLKRLSKKVFLAAPSTQVHLFLPIETRKLLFKKSESEQYLYKLTDRT